jgi:hypothetical protein
MNDNQHNDTRNTTTVAVMLCRYSAFPDYLNVSVIMLSVIMQNVVMLTVVAPCI